MKKTLLLTFLISVPVLQLFAQSWIQSHTPKSNAPAVNKAANLIITFNVSINEATLTNATIRVNGSQSGLHSGTITYDEAARTATIDPATDFKTGEVVTVTLTTGIQAIGGVGITTPHSWSFTVGAVPSNGTFANQIPYATNGGSASVYVADLDGDADVDMVTVNSDLNTISVLRNNGDGTFANAVETYDTGYYPVSVCAADLDGDMDMDLIVANGNSYHISIFRNNGDGTFAIPAEDWANGGTFSTSVCAADVDGDGDMDVVTSNYYVSNDISVIKNNGDGSFAAPIPYATGHYPYAICAADLDGDGDIDIVTANNFSNNISVLKNNGDGTFADQIPCKTGNTPNSVYATDIDKDGDIDLITANIHSNDISVIKNNSDGSFAAPIAYKTGSEPVSAYVADINGDGYPDVITANNLSNTIAVLKNNGDDTGTLADPVIYVTGAGPASVSVADLDGDNKLDLISANYGLSAVSVLKNADNTPLPVKWVSFTGYVKGQQVELAWSTAYEKDNSHFEVLRSVNGQEFTAIGRVPGHNHANAEQYRFTDVNPLPGINYYRLRQVDVDGASSESAVIAVNAGLRETDISISQTADRQNVAIVLYAAKAGKGTVRIYDVSGRKLAEQTRMLQSGRNTMSIPLQQKGIFIAVLATDTGQSRKKFITE